MAVDSKGNVYITDFGNKRVQKFSSNSEFLNEWGKSGKLGGGFHYPSGITIDEKYVFVVDRDLHRIQKFDNAGNSAHSFQIITVNACGKSHSEYTQIHGTDQDDILNGTNNNDLIFALDGKDLVNGGNGDDILYGDDGNDTLNDGNGNDILKGFSGNDIIYGSDGKDVIDGGDGDDHCYALEDDLIINCES